MLWINMFTFYRFDWSGKRLASVIAGKGPHTEQRFG